MRRTHWTQLVKRIQSQHSVPWHQALLAYRQLHRQKGAPLTLRDVQSRKQTIAAVRSSTHWTQAVKEIQRQLSTNWATAIQLYRRLDKPTASWVLSHPRELRKAYESLRLTLEEYLKQYTRKGAVTKDYIGSGEY